MVYLSFSCSSQEKKNRKVLIKTTMGDITVLLYDETAGHRDNFIKLVEENFYDSLLFHRVINKFMAQAGDPESKNAEAGKMLGSGGPGYQIPAEIKDKFFHHKGALAAARSGNNVNPEKKSSGSQFYIVQGQKYEEKQLKQMEFQINQQRLQNLYREYMMKAENKKLMLKMDSLYKSGNNEAVNKLGISILEKVKNSPEYKPFQFSEEKKKAYTTLGGAPHLDGEYTVFGKVIKGLDILDKICAQKVNNQNRPETDIIILDMKIIK